MYVSFLISLFNDNFLSVYFSGIKEGVRDVKISVNFFDSKINCWSEVFIFLIKEDFFYYLYEYIKKLGNFLFFLYDDKILLFVVGVSMGGWVIFKIY